MDLQENQWICQNKYRIERLIGEGAFARVWLAEQTKPSRQVAIKELKVESLTAAALAEQSRRFEREIAVADQLRDNRVPNVVYGLTTEPYGSKGAEVSLLVLEYMPGGSLLDLLKERPGGLPVERAVQIASDLCRALAGLHELGMVHRDVKPSNVLFRSTGGTAHLADFGTVETSGELQSRGSWSLGTANRHPGTPAYMSPEQRDGTGPLTGAADIYSLGCVIHDMLTGESGRSDVPGELPGKLRDGIPPWLDRVVEKCLRKQPAERYQTAEELRQALADAGKVQASAKEPEQPPLSHPQPRGEAREPASKPQGAGAKEDASVLAPAEPNNKTATIEPTNSRLSFPSVADGARLAFALLALGVTLTAFLKPDLFPAGLPAVLTSAIGVASTAATIALSAPLVNRAFQAVRTPGGSPVLEYLALILGTGMIVVALVGLFLAFFAYLSRGPGAATPAAISTPTLTLMAPMPSDTPTATSTPVLPTDTWTPAPTASPAPPSHTVTTTSTPRRPTPTGTPTRTPPPPTSTWTPAPTLTRPAPTSTPIPPTATATRRLPTATPRPTATAPRSYAAPQLVAPADGASFPAGATVTLQWASAGPLAAGDHYLLVVRHSSGASWVVTDSTSWVVPAWLEERQPVTWWVTVCGGAQINEPGYDQAPCPLVNPRSEDRGFRWDTNGAGDETPPGGVTPPGP